MTRLFATAAALLALGTTALAESPAQIEANKQAVLGFYQAALNDKDFDAAQSSLPRTTSSTTPRCPTARRASGN